MKILERGREDDNIIQEDISAGFTYLIIIYLWEN